MLIFRLGVLLGTVAAAVALHRSRRPAAAAAAGPPPAWYQRAVIKAQELDDASSEFLAMARQLRQQQERPWWQF